MTRIATDTGPFTIVPEWLLDASVSDRAVRLYALIGRYADRDDSAHPSRSLLAKRLGCSLDSVDRAVRELVGADALQVENRYTKGTRERTSNRYLLLRAKPEGSRTELGSRTDAATGSRTGAAENENQFERDTEPPNGGSAQRLTNSQPVERRNPVWDALTEVFGDATTETARTRRGKVCRSLTAAHATPEEILRRARSWPRHFDDATLTDLALEKHWDVLGRKPLRVTR